MIVCGFHASLLLGTVWLEKVRFILSYVVLSSGIFHASLTAQANFLTVQINHQ